MSNLPPIRQHPPAIPNDSGAYRLAVHEALLPGKTDAERAAVAARAGFVGIEYEAAGLAARVPAVRDALAGAGLAAASVHLGWEHDFLAADERRRAAALDALRGALTHAVDLGAGAVAFVPQAGHTLDLPDLMPFKAPIQLALELMTWHLRGYSDLAYVFGVDLHLHPVNRYQSAFLNRLEQGVELRRRVKFHEHVWLAADTFHMATAEPDPLAALAEHGESVRLLYLSDSHGGLPGTGSTDFGAVMRAHATGSGWAVVRGYHMDRPPTPAELTACVVHLHGVGVG